jgi:hypothetical protein
VLVDTAGLVVLHLWPGWEQIFFLTGSTRSVLGIVDAALIVGIVGSCLGILALLASLLRIRQVERG